MSLFVSRQDKPASGVRCRSPPASLNFHSKKFRLEVSHAFYLAFRRLELDNRKIQNWDWRHREFNEVWEETLQRRALRLPKSLDELLLDAERDELLYRTIDALPETQKRRFLLHYDCGYTYRMIGRMEGCSEGAARQSVILAREKVRAAMRKYLNGG